jgi:hypothetical protein
VLDPPQLRVRYEETGLLVARDVFAVALFSKAPYPTVVSDAAKAFEFWLKSVPREKLEWVRIGPESTSYRRLTTAGLNRCRAEMDLTKVRARDLGCVWVRGGDDVSNPAYSFTFFGGLPEWYAPSLTSVIEIRWPTAYPKEIGYDAFVSWVVELACLVPFRSAYASPALSRGLWEYSHVREGARHMRPLAFRHPGFDLAENEDSVKCLAEDQCRGARWLTLLGAPALAKLGGVESLRSNLDPRITLTPVLDGVLIRAGKEPELGDVNRGDRAPLLRSLARAIEPVTRFGDVNLPPLFNDDEDEVLRWERRHLD